MGNKFQRSMAIARDCYAVLKANPSLAIFPAITGIATTLVSIPFLIAIAIGLGLEKNFEARQLGVTQYLLTAMMYFCNYFVIIFFNAALVACANENLQGRPATVSFGIRVALQRLPQIIGWTAISSTVGVILRFISDRTGVVGQLIIGIIGIAWNLAVFFVVPILVLEKESPFGAVKASTGMIRNTWGERIMLGLGTGLAVAAFVLLALIPLAVSIGFLIVHIWMLAGLFFVIALMMVLVAAVVGSTLTTIYQTALYLYSRNGLVVQGFSQNALQGAFLVKPERKVFGMRLGR
jgi:hypothetical protein